jgi:hypothetical protein
MALVVPNEGEEQILNVIFGKSAAEDLSVRLYTNNYTPDESATLSSFTEASTFGYTSVPVTSTDWTIAGGNPTYGTTPELMFPFTGAAGNMYGYFVVGVTSGKVYWAELFEDGPINIQYANQRIIIPLKFGAE